jgi:hypothetical protein
MWNFCHDTIILMWWLLLRHLLNDLCREVTAVYSENHMNHINTLCRKNVKCFSERGIKETMMEVKVGCEWEMTVFVKLQCICGFISCFISTHYSFLAGFLKTA